MERNIQFCYIFFTKTCDLKYSGQVSGCFMHIKVNFWAFTCSKLTIETLEQGVKYVQS